MNIQRRIAEIKAGLNSAFEAKSPEMSGVQSRGAADASFLLELAEGLSRQIDEQKEQIAFLDALLDDNIRLTDQIDWLKQENEQLKYDLDHAEKWKQVDEWMKRDKKAVVHPEFDDDDWRKGWTWHDQL
jgi:dynactin complex subunit